MIECDKMRYEDRIRSQRLFVLGAGFSAAAGVPMTGSLLASAMERFKAECPGIFSRIDGYVRACFQFGNSDPDYTRLSLSEICTFLHYIELREYGGGERWSNAGSRENLALRFYLAKEIALSTPNVDQIPQLYRDFAAQLHPGDIVFSFNWDTLLSLEAASMPYAYQVEENRVTLIKLHGSINWRLGPPDTTDKKQWHSFGFTEGMMTSDVYWTRELIGSYSWRHIPGPLEEVRPFIVLPGFGKAFDVRHLAPFWYKPEFAFGFTHDIFIVGLSLARDDFIIRSLFLDNLPHVKGSSGVSRRTVIINPDPLVRDNFSFLVGNPRVDFVGDPFSEAHIALMKPALRDDLENTVEKGYG